MSVKCIAKAIKCYEGWDESQRVRGIDTVTAFSVEVELKSPINALKLSNKTF